MTAGPNFVRWSRRVIFAFICVGLAGWWWSYTIWYDYQAKLPRAPSAATGRIYPLNVHGIVVYQNRSELHRRREIQYSSFGLLVLGLLLGNIHQKLFGKDQGHKHIA